MEILGARDLGGKAAAPFVNGQFIKGEILLGKRVSA